ncbi:MAG: ThuA domain-containing protein [Planctomycetota bacterium]
MPRIRLAALCVLALAVALTGLPERPALAGGAPGERIRVLVLTGQNNHDCAFTSRLVETFLEKTGRFDVDVTDEPAKALADAGKLAGYRCFFLDYNGERWGEKAEANFLAAVRGGTGVVVMHAANNSFPGWVEYEKLVGHVWRSEKGTGHGAFHPFDVDVDDRNHPITSGLPALVAHPDELYHRLVHMHDAPFRQLMSALSSKESGGTGRREPMATILRYGEGRIFHTPLGHVWRGSEASRRSLLDAQLQMLLARGTEWAATGAVTLAPEGFGLAFRSTFERDRAWLGRRVTLDGRPDVRLVVLDEHMTVGWDPASAGVIVAWSGGHERVEKTVGPGAPLDPALGLARQALRADHAQPLVPRGRDGEAARGRARVRAARLPRVGRPPLARLRLALSLGSARAHRGPGVDREGLQLAHLAPAQLHRDGARRGRIAPPESRAGTARPRRARRLLLRQRGRRHDAQRQVRRGRTDPSRRDDDGRDGIRALLGPLNPARRRAPPAVARYHSGSTPPETEPCPRASSSRPSPPSPSPAAAPGPRTPLRRASTRRRSTRPRRRSPRPASSRT